MTERTLTLLDSGTVDLRTLDRVLQSVVFFADAVAMRASFEIAAYDTRRTPDIIRRIVELRERGLVALWAHEYEVDDKGRVKAAYSGGDPLARTADLVVDQARLRESVAEMSEVLRAMREEAYRREPNSRYRQGVAEIVSLRSHLTSLVISSELRQDGLLANPTTRAVFAKNLRPIEGQGFRGAVVQEVLSMLQLGSLRMLTTDQVDECRRASSAFRKLLDQSIIAVARGVDPVVTPAATARELVGRYNEVVTRYASR
jgi:hypothetical protein